MNILKIIDLSQDWKKGFFFSNKFENDFSKMDIFKNVQIRFLSENFIKVFMTFFLWSQITKIYLLFLLLRRSHFLLANHAIY